ncbi:hypothetical protein MMC29_001130 [Sticta canariensis]|nr:hypothetical protein [Sticta canariensis]
MREGGRKVLVGSGVDCPLEQPTGLETIKYVPKVSPARLFLLQDLIDASEDDHAIHGPGTRHVDPVSQTEKANLLCRNKVEDYEHCFPSLHRIHRADLDISHPGFLQGQSSDS